MGDFNSDDHYSFTVGKNTLEEMEYPHSQQKSLKYSESEGTQSYPALWNPMDCSQPGSSIHGIFQAKILEWVAIFFSSEILKTKEWCLFISKATHSISQ